MTVVSTTVTVIAWDKLLIVFQLLHFRTSKYIISVSDTDDSTFATTELVVHNGTASSAQFGDVTVGSGTVPDPL